MTIIGKVGWMKILKGTLLANKINKDLRQFLDNAKVSSSSLLALKSDASKRSYYRSKNTENNFLIMDSSLERKSLKNFIRISNWLKKKGYSSPDIFYNELSKGFCILEDFGDNKFSDLNNISITKQYNLTIKLLKSLSQQQPPLFLNYYSKLIFRKELNLFIDWYLFYNKKKNRKDISLWNEIWDELFIKVDSHKKKSIVLRDFHIDNLFWLKDRTSIKKIGLIDFQDAVIGHPAYDLVSLLQDVRVNISDKEQKRLYNVYISSNNINRKKFEEAYFILGTQRLIKIIGIFNKLWLVENKANYRKFLPRTWALLKKNIYYPKLRLLSDWFKIYVF